MKNFNKISKEKWIQLKRNADMYEVVGYQFGKIGNSRLDYAGGGNPSPSYYQNLPSYFLADADGPDYAGAYLAEQEFINDGQIDWERIIDAKVTNNISGTLGAYTLYSINTGQYNVAIGRNAGYAISDGDNNILIGRNAGSGITYGGSNIIIGSGSLGALALEQQLRIGNGNSLVTISGSLETGQVIGKWQRQIITHTTDFSISGSEYIGGYNIVGGNLTCSIATGSMNPGAEFEFFQTASAGNLLFVTASAGMDVVVKNGNMNLAGQGSGASLKYISGGTFHLVGDLT